MAYTADNLYLAVNPVSGANPRLFFYYDAAPESDSTIVGGSWFSDGVTKGMRKGDMVWVIQTASPKFKAYQVASTSGAAATVAAPTAIT